MKLSYRTPWRFLGGLVALATTAVQFTSTAQTLVNRYSFTPDVTGTNVVDSVGGSAWYGTIPNGGDFNTVPGQLILSAAGQQYVQLPPGILSNYTAVTIDCWATFGTLPGNCFLYGFGTTDGGGAGADYIFCQPENGRIAITGADPGYTAEQGCGGAGNFSGFTVHVTSVYNPPLGYCELYTNGVLVSVNPNVTTPMSAVADVTNYIARSLYNADSYMDVELDEFRIWNGALNGLQVAGSDVGGPDTVSTNVGTVTSIQIQVPYFSLQQGNKEASAVVAQASLFSGPITITRLATFSSSNTNILSVDTNGLINAVGQGSATITAQYGTNSSSQIITVVAPASVLAHEYSFGDAVGSGTVADSVGGVAWAGTLPNGGTLNGTGQLSLAASSSQYVQLPSGILSNYAAVTIDAWATFPDALPGNCFFFGFGNTDGGGAGEQYIYLQPSSGHIGITGVDPGYIGEQQAGTYGNLSFSTNIHVTAVFSPPGGYIAVYTNGILAGKNTNETVSLTSVSGALSYIARSLYNGDSYMDVNLDEFRIFDGALTSQGVAIADAAGPNSVPSGVLNGPGSLLSLTLSAPSTLQWLQTGTLKLLANYTGLTNWDIIGNSIFPPAGLSVFSNNTNVLTVSSGGTITAVNPGVASLTAIYQGTTNSITITVTRAPRPTLVHEYSFNDASGSTTAFDSIGGASWDGTLPNGGTFNGTGQLSLDAGSSQYVVLPSGILSNYTALTVEAWVTATTDPVNSMLYAFGNTDGGGTGEQYIFGSLNRDYTAITANDPGYTAEQGAGGGSALPLNQAIHFVGVYNPAGGYIAVYTNGVLHAINNGETDPLSVVSPVEAFIGKSVYNGDPYASLTLDEFRIYNGALSPDELAATQILGPTQLLSTNVSLSASISSGNVTLSWPLTGAGFSLQSNSSLTSGTWTTVATPAPQIIGNRWQITVPKSTGNQFFRLAR